MSVMLRPPPRPELEVAQADALNRKRDVGRGRLPWRMEKPVIYFEGRMQADRCGEDWRTGIDGFDVYSDFEQHDRETESVDCGAFHYSGPFILYGAGGHVSGHTPYKEEHQNTWDIDKRQIERADLIVAYLDDTQAFGTLVELGYAAALGKPIALGFSEQMKSRDYNELWLCRMTAAKVYWGSAAQVWNEVRHDWIAP